MKLFDKNTSLYLLAIFLVEAISFLGFYYPPFKIIGLIAIGITTLVLSLKNLEYGLLILMAELIIGSKGHLLDFSGFSLRMLIFSVVMIVFLIKMTGKTNRLILRDYLNLLKSLKSLISLALFTIIGLITALLNSNEIGNIVSDFNSWLFFLLFFPALFVYFQADTKKYERLITVCAAALAWLSFETLLILYAYSHNLAIMPDLYLWLRKTGVAEVTNTLNSFPRIFLQSHIYAGAAILITSFSSIKKNKDFWIISILSWSAIFLSMSRSFWLAIAICIFIGLIIKIKDIAKNIFFIGTAAIAGAVLIFLISIFPIPKPGSFSMDSFLARTDLNNNEAAVASRWTLLPALMNEIKKSPIIGQGYGSTVTYKSSDPRVLEQHPDGMYSTYAFEWGYLSIWLKLGILGLLSYLWLIGQNIYYSLKKMPFFALILILLALIHIFTPYLDHPLGIALLIMAIIGIESCVKQENKVY